MQHTTQRIHSNAMADMVAAVERLGPRPHPAITPIIAANAMAASVCSAILDVPEPDRADVLLELFAWFDKGSFHRESAPRRALRVVGDGLSDFLNHDDRYEG